MNRKSNSYKYVFKSVSSELLSAVLVNLRLTHHNSLISAHDRRDNQLSAFQLRRLSPASVFDLSAERQTPDTKNTPRNGFFRIYLQLFARRTQPLSSGARLALTRNSITKTFFAEVYGSQIRLPRQFLLRLYTPGRQSEILFASCEGGWEMDGRK